MRFLLLFLAVLAWAGPVSAIPSTSEQEVSAEAISAEMAGYGQWLSRLTQIQQPLQAGFAGLGAQWQEAQRAGVRNAAQSFRPQIAELTAKIDSAIVQLEALDTPEFPALDLPEEIRTSALKRETIQLSRQMRELIQTFNPLLDAIARNDPAAAMQASNRQMESIGLTIDSQILLTRATQAAMPRDNVAWEVIEVQRLFFQIARRIVAAWPHAMALRRDPGLHGDLIRLAGEADVTAREGSEKLERNIEFYSRALAVAERSGDVAEAGVMRRAIGVLTLYRDLFPLGQRLASTTRDGAENFRNVPISPDAILALFRQLQPIRFGIDAIIAQEGNALAGTQ